MSLRLRLLNLFLRLFVKPRLGRLRDPEEARRHLNRTARLVFRTPPLSLMLPVAFANGKTALWIANRPTRLPTTRRRVILYIHGGGYVAGSARTHAKMLARLSRLCGMEVFAPTYALAPEHPFPAGLKDVENAFSHLNAIGYAPEDIILGGDSAGGGLAFALLSKLCLQGRPPRALFALSPLTDFRYKGDSFVENATRDPLLPASRKEMVRDMYLNGHSPEDPQVSPLLAEFPSPPPVFLQFSTAELLRDDSRRMATRLRSLGGQVTEDAWADTPHVWVLFDGLLPEARQALERIAAFVQD